MRTTFCPPHLPGNHRKFPPPPSSSRSHPNNNRPNFPANHQWNHRLGPTASAPLERPNFVVDLVVEHRGARRPDVQALVDQCKTKPERFTPYNSGVLVGTLFFRQWVDTLEAMVWFWESRLDGVHSLIPKLKPLVTVPSDRDELRDRLRVVFADRIRRLIDGEGVEKWNKKRDDLLDEIRKISALLGKPKRLKEHMELSDRKKRLTHERNLLEKRVKEFKSAMNCMLTHLEGKRTESCGEQNVQVFKFEGDYNWGRIHSLMLRECRRLKDGLPIYAYRQDILEQVHSQQVLSFLLLLLLFYNFFLIWVRRPRI